MDTTATLDEIMDLVHQLSPLEKVRLIERIAPQIERDLQKAQAIPLISLRGIWQDADTTAEEIDDLRHEVWADFPRKDI